MRILYHVPFYIFSVNNTLAHPLPFLPSPWGPECIRRDRTRSSPCLSPPTLSLRRHQFSSPTITTSVRPPHWHRSPPPRPPHHCHPPHPQRTIPIHRQQNPPTPVSAPSVLVPWSPFGKGPRGLREAWGLEVRDLFERRCLCGLRTNSRKDAWEVNYIYHPRPTLPPSLFTPSSRSETSTCILFPSLLSPLSIYLDIYLASHSRAALSLSLNIVI